MMSLVARMVRAWGHATVVVLAAAAVAASVGLLLFASVGTVWVDTAELQLPLWANGDRITSWCSTTATRPYPAVLPAALPEFFAPHALPDNVVSRTSAVILHSMGAFGGFTAVLACAFHLLLLLLLENSGSPRLLLHATAALGATLAVSSAGFVMAVVGSKQFVSYCGLWLFSASRFAWAAGFACSLAAVLLQLLAFLLLLACQLHPRLKSGAVVEVVSLKAEGSTMVTTTGPLFVSVEREATPEGKATQQQLSIAIQGTFQATAGLRQPPAATGVATLVRKLEPPPAAAADATYALPSSTTAPTPTSPDNV